MSDLRASRRAETERTILDAVQRVLVDEHPTSLSMPQVADAAAVSLRTLYRYFPTKADLVDAASRTFEIQVNAEVAPPTDIDEVEAYLVAMWRAFDASVPAVLSQHATPAGRELRQQRLARSRASLAGALRARAPDMPDDDAARLVDTVALLTGSSTYLELTQHLGHTSAEAAHIAATAVRAVIDQAIGTTT